MKKKTLLVLAGIVLLAAGASSALVCYSIPEPKPDPIDISALGLDRHKAPAVTDPDLPESNMTLIASLRAPGNRGIKEIVVTPDGMTLATSCGDATVKLWDLERRQLMALTLTGQDNAASPLAVTSDGKTLAWASEDSVIHLWNLQQRIETSCLSGHAHGITALTFSPNGELLASASCDRSVKLWDVSRAAEKTSLPGHMDRGPLSYVTSLAFSPDGHFLASAGPVDFVRIWELPSCLESRLLRVDLRSDCVVFLEGGKILAYGTGGSMINLWDVKSVRKQ